MDEHKGHYASERNQAEKDKNIVWYHLYVEWKEYNKIVNITTIKKQQIPIYTEQTSGYQWGEGRVI